MNNPRFLSFALLSLLAWISFGCQSIDHYYHFEDFESKPLGWLEVQGRNFKPATELKVGHGRLIIDGSKIYTQDFLLNKGLVALTEFSVTHAEMSGYAGLLIEEVQDLNPQRAGDEVTFRTMIAFDGKGRWTSFDGHPHRLQRSARWKNLPQGTFPGPLGLEIRSTETEILVYHAGQSTPFHRFWLTQEKENQPTMRIEYRLGFFTQLSQLEVEHFLVGEHHPQGQLPVESIVSSGAVQSGETYLDLAAQRLQSNSSLLSILDALASAHRLGADISGHYRSLTQNSGSHLNSIHHKNLIRQFNERVQLGKVSTLEQEDSLALERAQKAKRAGKLGESLVFYSLAQLEGLEVSKEIRSLKSQIHESESLKLKIEYQNTDSPLGRSTTLSQSLSAPIREQYGSLRRDDNGNLIVHLNVSEAKLEQERIDARRRVYLRGARNVELDSLKNQLKLGLSEFEEELLDAEASIGVILSGPVDPVLKNSLKKYSFNLPRKKTVTLAPVIGTRLVQKEKELIELQQSIAKIDGQNLKSENFMATLAVDYTKLELHYKVILNGKVYLEDELSVSEGLEQWIHPQQPKYNLPAAVYDKEMRKQFIYRQIQRLAKRFGSAIDIQQLLARLSADEGTKFLYSLAKSSSNLEFRQRLSAWLRIHYKLESNALSGVVEEMMK